MSERSGAVMLALASLGLRASGYPPTWRIAYCRRRDERYQQRALIVLDDALTARFAFGRLIEEPQHL
ncbi:hypothetical protein [Actinopolymorpha pittospori]|uniref:Uncharacterized protein n=1 Tax=Actinopolymorpha pittospori TaxID=648752 RepID=A0A927N598_9ACTN|nr:hypothetical protein [Actinopolymorpha pittospori]MBE1612641.1 hypothetical protein [Actinopolymorpha pittospori]